MKHKISPLFPSIIHQVEMDNYDDIRKEVISYVYEERRKDPKGVNHSNTGGWQSTDTIHTSTNILSSTINSLIGEYLSERDMIFLDKDMVIETMWVNINTKGSINVAHIHPGSHWSGVMWIKVPPNSGKIWFDSPHNFHGYDEISVYNERFKKDFLNYLDYYFFPTEGNFILFPSYLYHRVEPNKSREDRISVSFNIRIYDK